MLPLQKQYNFIMLFDTERDINENDTFNKNSSN